jgi:hypothetical protein
VQNEEKNMDSSKNPFKFPGQYRKSFISKKSHLIELYELCVKDNREYFQWIGIRGFAHILEICDCWIGHDIVPLTHSLLMEYDYLCFSMGTLSTRSTNKLSSPDSFHSRGSSSKYILQNQINALYADRTFVHPQNQSRLLIEILEVLSEVFKLLPRLERKFPSNHPLGKEKVLTWILLASVVSLLYNSLTDVLTEGLCKSQEVIRLFGNFNKILIWFF